VAGFKLWVRILPTAPTGNNGFISGVLFLGFYFWGFISGVLFLVARLFKIVSANGLYWNRWWV